MSSSEPTLEKHGHVFAGNMNQKCKVCGEPAAGFHFGAFTCEGCKSFFGRTYNNLSSLNECKNGGRCSINKKTRTSCKSCRLRKCLMVGMSKSGSRYGRRSNWFKIHFLMQGHNAEEAPTLPTETSPSIPGNQPGCWEGATTVMEHSKNLRKDLFGLTSRLLGTEFKSTIAGNIQATELNINQRSSNEESSCAKNNQEFSLPFQVKELKSNTPSSSESHTPDSQKDLSDNGFIPNYFNDNLYPKDLLSLFNLPGLTHQFPSLLSPPSFTQRFLYPYYPQLLSLYSGTGYMDNILKNAERTTNQEDSKQKLFHSSESDDSDQDSHKGIQPPLKILKRCPLSPPPFQSTDGSTTSRPKMSPSIPSPSVTPKETDALPTIKGTTSSPTSSQSLPIDLSIRGKSPTSSFEDQKCSVHVKKENEKDVLDRNDNYKVSFVIDEVPSKIGPFKTEQQIPLDLSGFKT